MGWVVGRGWGWGVGGTVSPVLSTYSWPACLDSPRQSELCLIAEISWLLSAPVTSHMSQCHNVCDWESEGGKYSDPRCGLLQLL